MSFLTPLAFLGGLLAIPIILLYMLRLRRREVTISSTFLWQQLLQDREANTPWQRLRRNLLLLLDHQTGLFQTVKDITITELRNNTVMLARLATLLKIPVITTANTRSPNTSAADRKSTSADGLWIFSKGCIDN